MQIRIEKKHVEKFVDDVCSALWSDYNHDGEAIKGQSVSYLRTEMRGMGWRGLSGTVDFVDTLEAHGFDVVQIKNASIVTVL
jgi:hypothetical protein